MLKLVLVFALAATALAAPELEALARGSNEGETKRIWWDRGGLASDDFICWGPESPPGTIYKALGHRGQKNHDPIKETIYGFREINATKALADAESFEFIWDDRRSINWNDGSLWRPQCPTGYVATGDFFYNKNRITEPGQDLYYTTKCVRKDLTAICKIERKIWDDSGSLASHDVSVWEPTVDATMLGGFLFGNSVHEVPPPIEGRCLLKSAFTVTYEEN